jgi:25S rRNA (adenine2142-N1)-methyltransferase
MTKKRKLPNPIAPKPLQSRKKARQITSLFHKLTRQIDHVKSELAASSESETQKNQTKTTKQNQQQQKQRLIQLENEIDQMGGRQQYQRASQLSTKFHSTSKWVIKVLFQYHWLPHGTPFKKVKNTICSSSNSSSINTSNINGNGANDNEYQTVDILEVGAINLELINAASKTKRIQVPASSTSKTLSSASAVSTKTYKNVPYYNIKVHAIDIHSSYPDSIQEQDFLTLTVPNLNENKYNVIVCSMVLNCVTTAQDRGRMLSLLYQQLAFGDGNDDGDNCVNNNGDNNDSTCSSSSRNRNSKNGLCFLTIPKLCLTQSKYINKRMFEEMLMGVGFTIEQRKDTPKVAFWVLQKQPSKKMEWKEEWGALRIVHHGKKYRNEFGVVLSKEDCSGSGSGRSSS